jgi:DNA-binding NarL/FixJ family response regulator
MTRKVLIVDDSKLARMSSAKILKTCYPDWTRLEAGTAAEAMEAMQKQPPDIALIDFNMPARDGLHLAEELLKLHPGMQIAIISANHQQVVVDRATALGATFLPKPISEKSLGGFLAAAEQRISGGTQ